MSLLTIVQKAARQSKIFTSIPNSVIGNTDINIAQAQELIFEVGETLKMRYLWQYLVRETTFTTADTVQSYALSTVVSDGDLESFVGDTMFDTTNNREVRIISFSDWEFLTNTVNSSAGIDKSITLFDNKLFIYPTPTSTDTITFQYKSSQWITSSGGTGQDDWLADTDTSKFPEYLLQLGLNALILREFGVPYQEQWNTFLDFADAQAEKNRIKQRIFQPIIATVPIVNLPDTGFGT